MNNPAARIREGTDTVAQYPKFVTVSCVSVRNKPVTDNKELGQSSTRTTGTKVAKIGEKNRERADNSVEYTSTADKYHGTTRVRESRFSLSTSPFTMNVVGEKP